jgi:putative oxidoreductase
MNCICTSMMKTNGCWGAFFARLALGGVMLPHGLQKTIGAFGGNGFSGTMGFFTGTLGLPSVIAFLVIAAESIGAIAIVLGLMTRFSAASLAIVMAGAIWMGHLQNGFFMNWFGAQAGEGFEYHLLAIGLCLTLVASGGGALSLDRKLSSCGDANASSCCSR